MITIHVAVIKPFIKSGDGKFINNYRPISLLNNFSKILEKIIKSRLITLLDANQFGFIPGVGTGNALYKTTHLYNTMN